MLYLSVGGMCEPAKMCLACKVYVFMCGFLCKCYVHICNLCKSLQCCASIFSSFLYVTLLIFPWLTEIMILSHHSTSTSSFVNTILFCAIIQIGLSITGAIDMGYNFFCCCADSRLSNKELDKIIGGSANRVWCSSPMNIRSLVSPGYIIYMGGPWLLTNVAALKFLPDDMCFPLVLYLITFMPLLSYFPFFAVGSAYRNLMESGKLDLLESNKLKEMDSKPSDVPTFDSKLSPVVIDASYNKPDRPKTETTKTTKSTNQQLYDIKPIRPADVRGLSSGIIFAFMTRGIVAYNDCPIDVDDFERNRALLLWYPEWRKRILELGEISRKWKVLSENWSEIERLYEKDYEVYGKLEMDGECNKYIHKLLKSCG